MPILGPIRRPVQSWDTLARESLEHTSAGLTWTVHSVFRSAFNLVREDGWLLGVVTAPAGNGPATMVLAATDTAEPFTAILAPGDATSLGDSRVVVAERIALDLSTATLWTPVPVRRTVSAAELLARLEWATQIAAAGPDRGGLSPLVERALALAQGQTERLPPQPLSTLPRGTCAGDECNPRLAQSRIVERAGELLAEVALAIRDRRWHDVEVHARGLSGLGPGLTPAGDDALAGLALGLRATSGPLAGELQDAISRGAAGRTTDLAEARVRHALNGSPDEVVHWVLTELVTGTGNGLAEAVPALLAFGHSSGADTLVGLLIGGALGGHDAMNRSC